MEDPDLDDLLQSGYRYALSLTHEAARAEDLLQDASLSLTRKGGPWNRRYLFRVIRNRFIDGERRSKIVRFEPADTAEDPTEMFRYPEDTMQKALGVLEAEDRELIYLHIIEGWTARELARLTGSNRNTILSRIHRAKAKVRQHLTSTDGKEEANEPA